MYLYAYMRINILTHMSVPIADTAMRKWTNFLLSKATENKLKRNINNILE
jgi:hypothetical protein